MGLFSKGYFKRFKRRLKNTLKSPVVSAVAGFIPGGSAVVGVARSASRMISGLGGGANTAPVPRFSGRSAVSRRSVGGVASGNDTIGGTGGSSINPLYLVGAAVVGFYFIMG